MTPQKAIPITQALASRLAELDRAVVLRYEIAREAWRLYRDGAFSGRPLLHSRDQLDSTTLTRLERRLIENGVLHPVIKTSERAAYSLIGAKAPEPFELLCLLDPFAYVSHLSAMQFHGLTDRMPEQLYVSSPAPTAWSRFALERMQRDLGASWTAFQASRLPQLERIALPRIGNRPVHRYSSVHLGAFRNVRGTAMRVSALGRTFLDMLREPSLCGGLTHVIDAFREHGASNLRLIADELDAHGAPIDKVRAGYILEEVSGVRDSRVNAWIANARQGGSRKLDASAEYSPSFSERWCLSINVPALQSRNA